MEQRSLFDLGFIEKKEGGLEREKQGKLEAAIEAILKKHGDGTILTEIFRSDDVL